jgi:hypothetical protein
MILDFTLTALTSLLTIVHDAIFSILNVDVELSGLSSAVNFVGGIVYTTSAFVPYQTFGTIFGILFVLAGIRYTMQVINLIYP